MTYDDSELMGVARPERVQPTHHFEEECSAREGSKGQTKTAINMILSSHYGVYMATKIIEVQCWLDVKKSKYLIDDLKKKCWRRKYLIVAFTIDFTWWLVFGPDSWTGKGIIKNMSDLSVKNNVPLFSYFSIMELFGMNVGTFYREQDHIQGSLFSSHGRDFVSSNKLL